MDELLEKLKDLQHREFMVQMIDHWTQEDYRYDNELHQEIMKTKKGVCLVKTSTLSCCLQIM